MDIMFYIPKTNKLQKTAALESAAEHWFLEVQIIPFSSKSCTKTSGSAKVITQDSL